MTDEQSFDSQKFVEVVAVSDRTCGLDGCSAPPVATYAMVKPYEPGKVAYENVWACAEHLVGLKVLAYNEWSDGSVVTGWTQELVPTCLVEACAEDSTHVLFAVRTYGPEQRLEAISVCERHARQAERKIAAP